VTVDGSCNQGTADAVVDGDRLRVGSLVTTDKACGEPAATVEAAVARVLHGTVAYRIEASSLTLTSSDGAGLMLRAPA
jgi:heat shock protein HslJ